MKVHEHKMYNTQFFLLIMQCHFMGEKTLIFLSRQYLGKFKAFFYKNWYILMAMYCASRPIIASEVDTISQIQKPESAKY